MKKYTVDFKMGMYATFEGIEANSEDEAKEIAIEMLSEDPTQYLDFDDKYQVEIWVE